MCGIVGCILKDDEDAAPVLLECVKKLEYRGYDSVGIATVSDKINIKKDKGEIEDVDAKLNLADMPGNYGIAHVRWATHGVPSKENSHPQIDNTGKIAVVHNGINHKLFFPFIDPNDEYVNINPFAIKRPYFVYGSSISNSNKKHIKIL